MISRFLIPKNWLVPNRWQGRVINVYQRRLRVNRVEKVVAVALAEAEVEAVAVALAVAEVEAVAVALAVAEVEAVVVAVAVP